MARPRGAKNGIAEITQIHRLRGSSGRRKGESIGEVKGTGYLFLHHVSCFVYLTDPCLGFHADKLPGTPTIF
jgi:hypothetical protein